MGHPRPLSLFSSFQTNITISTTNKCGAGCYQTLISRSQHGQDEGPDRGLMPDVVVFPQTTEEVSEVSE